MDSKKYGFAYGGKFYHHHLGTLFFSVCDKLPLGALLTLHYDSSLENAEKKENKGLLVLVLSLYNLWQIIVICFSLAPFSHFTVEEARRFFLFHGGIPELYPIYDVENELPLMLPYDVSKLMFINIFIMNIKIVYVDVIKCEIQLL
jgi:hypothetical protein